MARFRSLVARDADVRSQQRTPDLVSPLSPCVGGSVDPKARKIYACRAVLYKRCGALRTEPAAKWAAGMDQYDVRCVAGSSRRINERGSKNKRGVDEAGPEVPALHLPNLAVLFLSGITVQTRCEWTAIRTSPTVPEQSDEDDDNRGRELTQLIVIQKRKFIDLGRTMSRDINSAAARWVRRTITVTGKKGFIIIGWLVIQTPFREQRARRRPATTEEVREKRHTAVRDVGHSPPLVLKEAEGRSMHATHTPRSRVHRMGVPDYMPSAPFIEENPPIVDCGLPVPAKHY
ncbi:hypothetical protein EDB92DRAFT_1820737 [Lactarius akahatsu]|uniref:Uncharacterized protein n=1 Tax=Lactarius akahatsu TaxID=416441 RepID=A0AAD4L6B7_9AGAM|nr:hypothetical protein EDB92DRAFT_1820737 [Lactarius akahatsu]